jgi:hypothetical protein
VSPPFNLVTNIPVTKIKHFLKQIISVSLIKYLQQVNEVHDKANAVFNLLRIYHVKVDLNEIHNMCLYVIKYYGDEANENSDFNLCKKLAYFNVTKLKH